jgi:predicted nucleic acid-binding protein
VAESAGLHGLLDTSLIIGLDESEREQLPDRISVSAITMAELAAGPHATSDPAERARRQDRLQRAESTFDPLPFDADPARAYGRISASPSRPTARRAAAVPSTC